MNFTSRMAALLGELRRERNGAVADSMRFYGKAYGLNYGVSLPTLRRIARAETPDADFASYLYLQDVRELRLLAFHIACPERISAADFSAWAAGVVNSEVAEEAAFALLWRIEPFGELFSAWISSENPLLQYAALMAASRSSRIEPEWIELALEVVRRHASNCGEEAALPPAEPHFAPSDSNLPPSLAARLTAQGAVALLAAFGNINEENRQTVIRTVGSPCQLPAMKYLYEELVWRLQR